MTQRDMSYDLDGIFATRQQGQLLSTVPTQTKMIRTPGLSPVPTRGVVKAMGIGADPVPEETITLPIIGTITKRAAILLGGLSAYGVYLFLKHEAPKMKSRTVYKVREANDE